MDPDYVRDIGEHEMQIRFPRGLKRLEAHAYECVFNFRFVGEPPFAAAREVQTARWLHRRRCKSAMIEIADPRRITFDRAWIRRLQQSLTTKLIAASRMDELVS